MWKDFIWFGFTLKVQPFGGDGEHCVGTRTWWLSLESCSTSQHDFSQRCSFILLQNALHLWRKYVRAGY